jgi:hypothetical protein
MIEAPEKSTKNERLLHEQEFQALKLELANIKKTQTIKAKSNKPNLPICKNSRIVNRLSASLMSVYNVYF